MIKIEASGDGYLIRGKEISKQTYEHFKDDGDLLEQHVTQYEDDSVPEEISIGIHEITSDALKFVPKTVVKHY